MRSSRAVSHAAVCGTVLLTCLPAGRGWAADATPPTVDVRPPASGALQLVDLSLAINVIAQRLDAARQQIQPSLGAGVYNFSPQVLPNLPQGSEAPENQVRLQAPGVAQDSFGQIHLRGEHANVP